MPRSVVDARPGERGAAPALQYAWPSIAGSAASLMPVSVPLDRGARGKASPRSGRRRPLEQAGAGGASWQGRGRSCTRCTQATHRPPGLSRAAAGACWQGRAGRSCTRCTQATPGQPACPHLGPLYAERAPSGGSTTEGFRHRGCAPRNALTSESWSWFLGSTGETDWQALEPLHGRPGAGGTAVSRPRGDRRGRCVGVGFPSPSGPNAWRDGRRESD